MGLTDKELVKLVRSMIEDEQGAPGVRDHRRREKYLRQAQIAAPAFYFQILQKLRQSGLYCSKRRKDLIWNELQTLQKIGRAIETVPEYELSPLRMVSRNESRFTIVIFEGMVRRWHGLQWIDERIASETDWRRYPVVITG